MKLKKKNEKEEQVKVKSSELMWAEMEEVLFW